MSEKTVMRAQAHHALDNAKQTEGKLKDEVLLKNVASKQNHFSGGSKINLLFGKFMKCNLKFL